MSTQAKLYMILTNPDGEKCIFLTPQKISKTKPQNPEIAYDGGKHAILYRNPNETIILDYIPTKEQNTLKQLKEILVVEYDVIAKKIATEYTAKITISTKIPDIEDNIIKK